MFQWPTTESATWRASNDDIAEGMNMALRDVRVKRVTLKIDEVDARDLLVRVPRACVAFITDDGPQAEPVNVHFKDDRYLVGMPSRAAIAACP